MKLFICLLIAFLNVKNVVELAFGFRHVLILISIFCSIKIAIYKLEKRAFTSKNIL